MAKKLSKNYLAPPLDRGPEGALVALANAQAWLRDAEHLQAAGGTPGHVIALATYAEEEAAKAFVWTLRAMLVRVFPPPFVSLIDRLDREMNDHAFRWYIARNLEGLDTTTVAVPTFFGLSMDMMLEAIATGILPGLASDAADSFDMDQLGSAFMTHPAVRPMVDLMLQQVFGWSGEDPSTVRETIKEMRRVRNQALYVDWNSQSEGFSTPLASSEDAVQDRMVRARAVVEAVETSLPLIRVPE